MARIFKPSKKPSAQMVEKAPTELFIESLSPEGRGVARYKGKAVFVTGALPDENVKISHYERKKRFSECRTKSIIEPSPYRVEPFCPHYGVCGGCELQHLQEDEQLRLKQKSVIDALCRQIAQKDFTVMEPIRSERSYRSRARLAVSSKRELCFRERQSSDWVPISQCPILEPRLQAVLPALQDWLSAMPEKCGVTHIELIQVESQSAVIVRHVQSIPKPLLSLLESTLLSLGVLVWWQDSKNGSLKTADGEVCDPRLRYDLAGVELGFHPSDFTQVNHGVNQLMVDQALEWLELKPSDVVMDLFCGIGNFTLPIARKAAHVTGIEGVESMVRRGLENAEQNGLDNVSFKALNLDQPELGGVLKRLKANKFLLDPPRSGAKYICEQLGKSGATLGVYVSCNPASLVRDTVELCKHGYKVEAVRVLDMFPHTGHVETMVLFKK